MLFEHCYGYIHVPEHLLYGEELARLEDKLETVC